MGGGDGGGHGAGTYLYPNFKWVAAVSAIYSHSVPPH